MKVISLNLNGIRAAARKGLYDWLPTVDADIVCLQELKAQPDQIEGEPYHPPGYHTYFHAAEKKGYSGVGIYSKQKPDQVQVGLGDGFEDVDSEGRYLQVDFGDLSVVSLYMPSGSSKEERQAFKIDLMDRFESRLQAMVESGRQWIICGDWNIAHKKADIKNWRGNQKNSGFLPEERSWMDWLYGETVSETGLPIKGDAGFVDAFRVHNNEQHQYTWWSNRGQAWANNTGWRIDYHVITRNLRETVISGSEHIYKEQRFSDHAPLVIEYDI
ncbi:MAG: exodeoxyribonuclease III [Arenicella sp.]|nr:exodeoxyribonuclease III [Arenicella sp.]